MSSTADETPGGITRSRLLDPEFIAQLQHLRIVTRRVARGGRFAEHPSKAQGAGIEFQDYRPYTAGDDLRAIDWNIYRRLGRVFLRLFEELEDLPLYLLPDVSGSMFHQRPRTDEIETRELRAFASARTAIALASISLGQHDRVGLFPFADDLDVGLKPQSGKGRLMRFADYLAGLEAGGTTDLRKSLSRFGALGLRQGLVVIISDFFDPGGLPAITEALANLRHRVLLVQLASKFDREPDLAGDVRLVDCETGAEANVSVTTEVLYRYRAAVDRFDRGLAELARTRGYGLLRVDMEKPLVPQLATLFESGAFVA